MERDEEVRAAVLQAACTLIGGAVGNPSVLPSADDISEAVALADRFVNYIRYGYLVTT